MSTTKHNHSRRRIGRLFRSESSDDDQDHVDDTEEEDDGASIQSLSVSLDDPSGFDSQDQEGDDDDENEDDVLLERQEDERIISEDYSSESSKCSFSTKEEDSQGIATDDGTHCSYSTVKPWDRDDDVRPVDGKYWAIEEVLDYNPDNDQYLVEWKGRQFPEPWWVVDNGLTDSAMPEADVVRHRVLRRLGLPDCAPPRKAKRKKSSSSGGGKSTMTNATSKKKTKVVTPSVRRTKGPTGEDILPQPRRSPRLRDTRNRSGERPRGRKKKDDDEEESVQSLRTQTIRTNAIKTIHSARPVDGPCLFISALGGQAMKIRVVTKPSRNFLQYTIAERLVPFDVQLMKDHQKITLKRVDDPNAINDDDNDDDDDDNDSSTYPPRIVFDGRECGLLSVRFEQDRQDGQSFVGNVPQKAVIVYATLSPNQNGTPFSIQDYLLNYGDFSVLDPRKIAARLALFQSPGCIIQPLPLETFGEIEEEGNVGCGFISSTFLEKLCRKGGIKHPEMVSAIQVRLFIPSMGIFKGMLQAKRITSGPEIQLPPSMKKVPASTTADCRKPAFIVVRGVHPSFQSANDFIGRSFKGTLKARKSFEEKIKKPLGPMVLDLWSSLGVPEDLLKQYKSESRNINRRHHAWVVGTIDPTGSLPPDHVFIPGMGKKQPDEIFVTRSPCLRHDHGRLLTTVTTQPFDMPKADWEFLDKLEFGSIIFSRPNVGKMSMPEHIACGDLDGDLYLICWDPILLSHMNDVDAMPDKDTDDDGFLKTLPSNPHWLEDTQKLMFDARTVKDVGRLIGQLYNMSIKIGKTSKDKKRDKDAMALADAYNEALEFTKHGRPIRLPRQLINDKKLEPFRKVLTPL